MCSRAMSLLITLALLLCSVSVVCAQGLTGHYFNNTRMRGEPVLTRIESVDFDWGTGSPDKGVNSDDISARWTGGVVPLYSDLHTISTRADEGIRVWLDGELIIDSWRAVPTWLISKPITLTADKTYSIMVEWYETNESAVCELYWQRAGQPREIIPAAQLLPELVVINARRPSPEDNAVGVTSSLLTWSPGETAIWHDLYLGTDRELGHDEYIGRMSGTQYPYIADLEAGETYYWRIDEVEEDGTVHEGDVWNFTAATRTAFNPSPRDGDRWINPNIDLTWSAGMGAISHDIYYGTNRDEVANGTSGTFKGNQVNTTFDPGTLARDTTYYWRVDEHDSTGLKHVGDVWSFTTAGLGGGIKGEYFNNMNLAGLPVLTRVDEQVNFDWRNDGPSWMIPDDGFSCRWTAGLEVDVTDEYTFITHSDDGVRLFLNGEKIIDNWAAHSETYDYSRSIELQAGQKYSLVMEMYENTGSAVARLLWQSPSMSQQLIPKGPLQPPLKATAVEPRNTAINIPPTVSLRWTAGVLAFEHDVYFGDDEVAVTNATPATSGIYRGRQVLDAITFYPGELQPNKTYYWRIDEVNNTSGYSSWKSHIWSFTTGDFFVVDSNNVFTSDVGNRGLIALEREDGSVFLSWRLFITDPPDTAFKIARSENPSRGKVMLLEGPPQRHTHFVDHSVEQHKTYNYELYIYNSSTTSNEPVAQTTITLTGEAKPYLSIPLAGDRSFNSMSIGDLDGDGAYEFIIKTQLLEYSGDIVDSHETHKLEAYRLDGSMMWRYDMGQVIYGEAWWSPWMVYDVDGDGMAEVYCQAGEGCIRDEDGKVMHCPEYLVKLDGRTGRIIAQIDWPLSREGVGDQKVQFFNVAYLDGRTPSLIMRRGNYNPKILALDKNFNRIWYWVTTRDYRNEVHHGLISADVDADGRDEIVVGPAVIDDNGRALRTPKMGHADACYVADIIPDNPGLEIFYGFQTNQEGSDTRRDTDGLCVVDAKTGRKLWGHNRPTYHIHTQGMVADIFAQHPGMEVYAGEAEFIDRWLYSAQGKLLAFMGHGPFGRLASLSPRPVWWDNDPQKEFVLHHISISDWYGPALTPLQGHMVAVMDCLGDHREEVIARGGEELRIYSTTIPTIYRRPCLMQDRQYRMGVAAETHDHYHPPQLGQEWPWIDTTTVIPCPDPPPPVPTFPPTQPSPVPLFFSEDFEAGDFKFNWIHGRDEYWNVYWNVTSEEKNSGQYCAQACSISDGEVSSCRIKLNCISGEISFYRKVSSERNCDFLEFYIDGIRQDRWSGEQDWVQVSFPVEEGTRRFEWSYSKDSSISRGSDTAWIDDIVFPSFF